MPAQLVALNDGPSILLDKPILLLGRHPECDIQIDSRKVSRRHCCIAQVHDYLVVRDLASTNGIRINGVRVLEGRLTAGDELTIGNHRYQVSWEPVAAPASPARRGGVKETFRAPLPADQVDDELLEACDEPMPLAEPGEPNLPPLTPQGPTRPLRTELDPPASPLPPRQESVILPEHLELMPGSDVIPNVPSHSSGSHPPG
jgi:predicted component of type VI protein secretion system